MPKKAKNLSQDALQSWKEKLRVSNIEFENKLEKNRNRWKDYYKGNQWGCDDENLYSDKLVDNMVFSNIQTIMPSINLRRPKIFVNAKKKPYKTKDGFLFDTLGAAATLEVVMNYYYKELELKREVDKCLLDALIGPWGLMFIGFTVESEKVDDDDNLLEVNELIKSESPFAIRISPDDFRYDIEAKDSHLNDARWIAIKWVKTVDEVKSNPNYKNVGDIKPNMSLKTAEDTSSGTKIVGANGKRTSNEEWDRIEGWDIYDKITHRIITIVASHKKELRNEPWPLKYEGFPVEVMYFNESPDEILPISDISIYEKSQDELNRTRSLQLSHIRRLSHRKYIAKDGKIDEENRLKLTYGGDGTVVNVKGDTTTSVVPLKDATISQDIYIAGKMLKDDIREQAGTSVFEKGVGAKFDTATEPALIQQSISTKRDARTAILEDFIKHVMSKLGSVIQQTIKDLSVPLTNEQLEFSRKFTPSRIESIAGEDDSQILLPWLNASSDDIKGEYDFDIEVGSTRPTNQEQRKRDVLTLYELLQGNPYIDIKKGTEMLLEAFDIKDLDLLMKSDEEVQQQQEASQQSSIEAEQALDAPKQQTDLAKTQMKTQTQLQVTEMNNNVTLLTEALKAKAASEKPKKESAS